MDSALPKGYVTEEVGSQERGGAGRLQCGGVKVGSIRTAFGAGKRRGKPRAGLSRISASSMKEERLGHLE